MKMPALPPSALKVIDDILAKHWRGSEDLLQPYRNHLLRMTSFCLAQMPEMDTMDLAIAAAFHDIGVWVVPTWDYLPPSRQLARDWMQSNGHASRITRVEAMIENHHKMTPYRGADRQIVEVFRRADWMDVSRGRFRFGVPTDIILAINRAHPNIGFHVFLRQRTRRAFMDSPLNPLPMFKW